jgi:hypothetical protein
MEPSAQIEFKNNLSQTLLDLKLNSEEFHVYAARSLGLDDNLTEAFQKERAYKNALKHYKDREIWKRERNKSRYELEEKFNFDTKHGMHLVRLYLMCIEALTTHTINVKRSDAEFLLSIRNGAWSYDELIDWASKKDEELNELYKTSTLRHEPNRVEINNWLINTQINFYNLK